MEIKIESTNKPTKQEITKEGLAEFMAMFRSLSNKNFKREIILLTKNLFISQIDRN